MKSERASKIFANGVGGGEDMRLFGSFVTDRLVVSMQGDGQLSEWPI